MAFVAVVLVAPLAQAQMAATYTNPLDASSDLSNWSYYDGYPFYPAIDSNPTGGHSGQSLNWNDANGSADVALYNYWYAYGETELMDCQGLQNPVFSFWCKVDAGPASYTDRYVYMYDAYYNWGFYYSIGDSGYDLNCGSDGEWHQHQITLDQNIVSSGGTRMYFWNYFEYYSQGSSGTTGYFLDHMQILVADTTPPDSILDLAAANPTLTEIELSWTSPYDDDVSGETASFDLRVSTTPITGTNFNSATPITGEPAPGAEGTAHNVLVTGLTESTTYYFAIQTTDIAGNVSAVSNVVSLATLTPPPPPPPPPAPGSGAIVEEDVPDDILPCSAGTNAAPTGLMALAGLIALAAFAGMVRK